MDDREAVALTLEWFGVAVLEGTCGAAVAVGVEGVAAPDDWVSSVDGSDGGGPSIAHRRDSYFERMNDSILLLHASAGREVAQKVKNPLIGGNMTGFKMCFPVQVC